MMTMCQPEKLKPEVGVKTPGTANVNIGMTLVSTKNLAKMGSKVFAAPVCFALSFITARRSYASAVLGVVILSVCLSVRHTRAL